MSRNFFITLVLFALCCAACLGADSAVLTVKVSDPSGAPAPGALVELRAGSNAAVTAKTGPDGKAQFSALAAGEYTLRITLSGFSPVERAIVIAEAQPLEIAIALALAPGKEEIEVTSKAGALANSDPNYSALRDAATVETYTVNELKIQRDRGVLTLHAGRISFSPPLLGRVTMASFSGQGEFTLAPLPTSEIESLRRITGQDSIHEEFSRLALVFTDDTYRQISQKAQPASGAPEMQALKESRERLRQRQEQPRSMLESLLTDESMDNVDADVLADLYNPRPAGFFNAYIIGKKHSDLRFEVRPRGALLGLLAPEEVAVMNVDAGGKEEGIWYLAHLEPEYQRGVASSNEDKRSVHPEHYAIETVIGGNERLAAVADLTFTPVIDGERVIKFGLLPSLRVTRVSAANREIPYIQEGRKHDGSFYVIWPERLKTGEHYKVKIEYEGNKVVRDEGSGNFSVEARTSWYPSLNAFGDRSTFDLTFKFPKQYTLIAVGKLDKEWKEGGFNASHWTSDIPLAVAGFNFGRYLKKEQTDPQTKYQIEVYATTEVPGYLRDRGLGSMTPSAMAQNALVDATNSIRLYQTYFGPAPYGRIAITQQPAFNFGQSWPTLVYLPVSAFLDATQRWSLLGGNTFRFSEFIQEVTPHEIAHQWWGHMVGWASFHDQWLSEGFAEFSAGLFTETIEHNPSKVNEFWDHLRKHITDKNAFGICPNDAGPIWAGLRLDTFRTAGAYRGLVYPKGAYVLHMLRMMMQDTKTHDQRFIEMMQDFVKTYYGQNASTEQFQRIVEKHMTPRMDLTGDGRMDWFFKEWIHGTELPSYRLEYSLAPQDGGKLLLRGAVTQSGVSGDFRMVVPVYGDFGSGPVRMGRLSVQGASTSEPFQLLLPQKPKRLLLGVQHDILARETVTQEVKPR